MKIQVNTQDNKFDPVTITLSGAQAGVVQEVRALNGLNGMETIYTGTAGPDGTLAIPVPQGFGGHYIFSLRAMAPGQADKVEQFRYAGQDGDVINFAQVVEAATSTPTSSFASRSAATTEVK
jgi:hypothetical protein